MIWYDAATKAPVAPGAGEDAGPPSIESYFCESCKNDVKPEWDRFETRVDSIDRTIIVTGYGLCSECGFIMLTTGGS